MTRDSILQEIELIYQLALLKGQLAVALRAKTLQGKALGIFIPPSLPAITQISGMTEDELNEFILRLEKNDPDLQKIAFSASD